MDKRFGVLGLLAILAVARSAHGQGGPPASAPSAPGAAASPAQKAQPSTSAAPVKPDYSKESAVIENYRVKVDFENDGTMAREITARVRVQSEAGSQAYGVLKFSYASATEQLAIDFVRVIKPDGKIVATPPEYMQDMPAETALAAPMYSDEHTKHVAVQGLGAGDALEYKVHYRLNTPLIPGQFWFAYDFFKSDIALNEEFVVSVPKDRYVNVKSSEVKPVITEEGTRRIYTWKTANLERPTPEDCLPGKYPAPAVELSTFRSWEEVGRWWGLLEQRQVAPTEEIRTKAAELTKDARNDEEKLGAIYQFVSTKYRYIGISFGIGRYEPHAAGTVLANQFGDCKDKHTLLASLLQAAGLEAYPALIGSLRKLDPDVPSPGQFDHVIGVVPLSKDRIWVDTTPEVGPLGYLTPNLRDKQALVIPTRGQAALMKTPPEPPMKSLVTFDVQGKLSDSGTLEARIQRSAQGDFAVLYRATFRQVPQAQWQELVQKISYASSFAGTVANVTASSPEAPDGVFVFSYDYTRKQYADWEHRRILPAIPSMGLPLPSEEEKKASQPIQLGAAQELDCKSRIALPKGFTPNLPQSVDLSRDFADYHAAYSFQEGVLFAERRLTVKVHEVPASQREDYRKFQKAVSDDEGQYIDLGGSANAPSLTAGTVEAQKLLTQAREALQRQSLREAFDLVERAVKADPMYKDAVLASATLQLAMGQVDQATASFRKAIELDPNDARSYKAFGFALMSVRRVQDAVQVWRDLLKQDPNEKDAHANLGSALLQLKKYGEAASELETAVKLNPQSAWLESRLGEACFRLGKKEEGAAAYAKAVELDPKPGTWNNASYALADHNVRLSDAQQWGEKAVQSAEAEATKITLDSLQPDNLGSVVNLSYYWDTLGWVYFRQGELEKAEKYVHASWSLSQSSVVGDHLGQIYEKQGKTHAAAHLYALALAAAEMSPAAAETSSEIRAHLGKLVKDNVRSGVAIGNAREELSRMRTVKLGRLTSKSQSAEFFVLFSSGAKVDGVKFVSGAEDLRSLTKAIAAAKYNVPLPDEAPTKIVRRGLLVCGPISGCDFALYPPNSVFSTN